MSITFTCECGKSVQVSEEFAGLEGQCPSCQRTVRIPATDAQISAPPIRWRQDGTAAPRENPRSAIPLSEADDVIARRVSHAGVLIDESDDFFVDPPLEIGRIYSAFSTLKRREKPMSAAKRGLLACGVFLAGATAVLFATTMVFGKIRPDNSAAMLVIAILVGGVLACAAVWGTRFRHTCSYVGARGIALFACAGERDRLVRSEVFFFADAAELRISQTRNYYNALYTGTQYSFVWTNERGDTVHQLSGHYKSEEGNPGPADAYHFSLMAENAWTMHLMRGIDRVIDEDALLFFGLKGGDYIELGRNEFILVQGSKSIELRADRIEKMTVGNGVISVWEVGAKSWFVDKGIHQFMYHDLGNARFFLFAIEKLLGIRF